MLRFLRLLSRSLVLCAVVLAASQAAADAPFSFATTPGTLPKDVVPIEYELHLVPDLATRTFRGTQTVHLDVRRPTRTIVMHALELEIESAFLQSPGGAPLALAPPLVDPKRQTIAYTLPAAIVPGRHDLTMAWRGVIHRTVDGLFADSYPTPSGAKLLLATDLEPTGARRILPCWDEPSFRARFRLSADLPAGYAGFSNMPIEKREALAGGVERVSFATTPKMSSYLLVLVAGDFERVAARVDGTEVGVVAPAGRQASTRYPLEAGVRLLQYYNAYFGVPYPLPKLDQIALPGGFRGGMENWGGIVYNEASLLVEPDENSGAKLARTFGLVAHEVAHQWFGDLVTMAWWDNLWLNEAFASWMAAKATDRLNPQWRLGLDTAGDSAVAMELDARLSTHPIQQPIGNESEAEDAFDDITYKKGGGFLRMLEAYLGEAPFRAGIRAYMARHRYSNTTGADLWTELADASGQPVAAIAADWTTQPGFPLVSVDARCDSGQRQVQLRQEQFFSNGTDAANDRLWRVPIPIAIADAGVDGAATSTLLAGRSATVALPGCAGALIVDPDDTGFYRVLYAKPLFDALVARWPTLPDGARLKLAGDTAALARAGRVPLADYAGLLARLGDEPRLIVWRQVVRDLGELELLTRGEPSREAFHRFASAVLAPRFGQLGWDERSGESGEDRQLRSLLAESLSTFDDAATIGEARIRFARFVADPARMSAEQRGTVIRIAGRHADAATFDLIKGRAGRASAIDERLRYYRALIEVQDAALVDRALPLALASEVPKNVRHEVLRSVSDSGRVDLVWAYAQAHVDDLLVDLKQYTSGGYFGGLVKDSASTAIADELETFAKTRLPEGALAMASLAADEIRSRARTKARLLPQIDAVLTLR